MERDEGEASGSKPASVGGNISGAAADRPGDMLLPVSTSITVSSVVCGYFETVKFTACHGVAATVCAVTQLKTKKQKKKPGLDSL